MPVTITCGISPRRPVVVNEILIFTAANTPAGAAVSYVFDHGDGTLDPGKVSEAFYRAPGIYTVTLRWTYGVSTGNLICGTVTVLPGPGMPTPTPTPAPISIGCLIAPSRPVVPYEMLTFTALQNPANAVVSFVFDHGDGTLDPRRVSQAFYDAAGTYTVTLRWSYNNQSGTVLCGTVTVSAGP